MSAELGSQRRQDEPRELVAGRYELTQRLARGGMGEVHAAFDRSTGKAVALKRLRTDALAQRSVVVHFMREYHALSELRHPRIIEVYDYGVDHDAPYYTMELLDGQDLRDLSPLPFKEACFYLRDVASSLALLHARRLLHRDISPRNVRRTNDGHCKLIDFGAMIAFGIPPNVTGTAPCISPEALQGASLDQRTDLYSLGALAYCVLTGKHAYPVSQLEQLSNAWKQPVVRPKQLVHEIPDALDELVMSLMSLDPMQRPKSAAEVIDWLSAIGQLPPDDASAAARSFLTGSRLCGRDTERKQLTRRLQRGLADRGSAALIEGPVGSGKSRLLAEAALIAQTLGFAVVRAVARRQRGTDHSVAQDLLSSLQHIAPLEAEAAGAKRIEWPTQRDGRGSTRPKSVQSNDVAEVRGRLQSALTDVFCSVARARPLLIVVDDLENADEFSSSLITALAHQTQSLSLVVLASETEGRTDLHFRAAISLRSVAAQMQITDLDRSETFEVVESMFGPVPNLERLSDWMFRVGYGNPKLTLELAEHLMERGIVRYVEGTWVLPSDEITEAVPRDVIEALAMRVQGLSPPALALAELLSVRRGGASAEVCLAADGGETDKLFGALDELIRRGVLESAGHDYVFAQEAVRKTLENSLTQERSRVLHRRWVDALLRAPNVDLDGQLEAGWHLVHTEDELEGADLLARVGPLMFEQGLAMSTAIPAIEKALAVYERFGRPLEARLRLRSVLVLAGYLYDYRLAWRYGEETMALLLEATGFNLTARWASLFGMRLALLLAMAWTAIRRPWLPAAKRGPPVWLALKYLVRSAMGLMGVRAVALDAPGTRAIFEAMKPLKDAPKSTSGPLIYAACRAFALQMVGREGELDQALREAMRLLRRGRKSDMSELEYQNLYVGLVMSDGINECYRENSQALARADLLDGIGLRLAFAGAARIRMMYYLRRADMERADHYRRQIDLHAIQGGTTWQVEWFSVPAEGMAGATWTDLVMLRRSLDRLERLVLEVPSLLPMLEGIRIAYHFRRGEFDRAVEVGLRFVEQHPPRTLIGWGSSYAAIAISMVEAGRAAEAKLFCERALAHVTASDRAYFAMYAPLEAAYAMALGVLGDRVKADEIMRTRLDRLRAAGEHVSMVTLYQYQAKLGRLVHDRPALLLALQSMRDAALASGFPAVILLADRVAELRAKYRSSPLPPPRDEPVEPAEAVIEPESESETVVATFLRGFDSATERCRQALKMLAQCAVSDEAYLFAWLERDITVVAALDSREAPDDLKSKVRGLMQSAMVEPVTSIEVLAFDQKAKMTARRRFRVILLPGGGPGEEHWVGAAAVFESQEMVDDLPLGLVMDIGRALSEDLMSEHVSRARS